MAADPAPETTAVRLLMDVHDSLTDHYDVDTLVGDGDVQYRESPYSGVGADLYNLDTAIHALRSKDVRVVAPVARTLAEDAVIAECRRDYGPLNLDDWITSLTAMVLEARAQPARQVVQVPDADTSFPVYVDAADQ